MTKKLSKKLSPEHQSIKQALTLPKLIKWLRTREPEIVYNYRDPKNCLIAQYLTDCGFPFLSVTPHDIVRDRTVVELPYDLNAVSTGFAIISKVEMGSNSCRNFFSTGERTFGAALVRAKQLHKLRLAQRKAKGVAE